MYKPTRTIPGKSAPKNMSPALVEETANSPGILYSPVMSLNSDFLNKSLILVQKGKQQLYTELDTLGLSYEKSQANFICVHLPKNAESIMEKLLDNGLIVRSLKSFNMQKSIRITIDTHDNNSKLIDNLKKYI